MGSVMTKKQMVKKLDKIVSDIELIQFEAKQLERDVREHLQHSKKEALIALNKLERGAWGIRAERGA